MERGKVMAHAVRPMAEGGIDACELSDFIVSGTVYCDVHLTEDKSVITAALERTFPDVSWEDSYVIDGIETLKGRFSDLSVLKDMLARARIRDTARSYLMSRIRGEHIHFELNKQVLVKDRINLAVETHPLGNVSVIVRARLREDVEQIYSISPEDILPALVHALTAKE